MNSTESPLDSNRQIEYVIVVYAQGEVITIIGLGTGPETAASFRDACHQNSANWAYLIDAAVPGTVLAEYHCGVFTGL